MWGLTSKKTKNLPTSCDKKLITYSLELLIERRDRIKQVEEAYNAFCKANEELAEEIVVGREEMEVYYGEQSEGTGLYKALERAEWARTKVVAWILW